MPPQNPVIMPPAMPGQPMVSPPPPGFPQQPPMAQQVTGQMPQQIAVQPMELNPVYGHDKLAIASLILGIISLPASILNLLTLPIPIIGIVLGFIGMKRNKGLAIAGIVLSFIGIILSVVVIIVGTHLLNSKSAVNGSSGTGSANGSTVISNCYTFSLPKPFTQTDVLKNTDCMTEAIAAGSTDDMLVNSTALPGTVSAADTDAFLQRFSAVAEKQLGSKGQINARSFTTLDGVRAYQATGTENIGQYKYLGFLVALAPKDYVSASGSNLRAFIISYDSATSRNRLDQLVQSWHWQ